MTLPPPHLDFFASHNIHKKLTRPRRDDYEKRPVLSATIHPDLKRTLVAMSDRTVLVR